MVVILDIGISAAVISFMVLVAFAVRLLHTARMTVVRAEEAILQMQRKFDENAEQSLQLLRQSTELTRDVQRKLAQLDHLFASVDELSTSVRQAGQTVRTVSKTVTSSVRDVEQAVHNHRDAIAEAVELTTAGYQLWQRWQEHRRSKQQQSEASTFQEGAE
ncbi:DUF948 domain-containing protein [Paenibacillus hamazuiensis]|uniref:DUF948 domain-containing protein n=1 Tax=Paenibacillus hamazuiensis TaxID=2936508 RepID=UPI002010C425|nr:DUF948 domain-containing protein [Paenibacillus hamazuiensis]